MVEVALRLGQGGDPEPLRHPTGAEAGDLWKDEPHPVRFLPAGPEFPEDLIVDAVLSRDELSKSGLGCHLVGSL